MATKRQEFDFKFLNKIMYLGAIIGIFYFLKSIGIVDKIYEAIVALVPVYIGIIICWLTMPLVKKLRSLGLSKKLAAIISLIIVFGIIIAVFSVLIPVFVEQLSSLIKELPDLYNVAIDKINDIAINKLGLEQEIDVTKSLKSLNIVKDYLDNILDYSINTVQSVINIIVSIFTVIVVSFFMAQDIDRFKSGVITFLSKNGKASKYKMINEIDMTITSYLKGMFIDSVVVGILTTIVCLVLGIDYAVIFGILILILNFIPYIGALLSELIIAVYALTTGGPVFAIITFACLLGVQLIDANILQPKIVAKSVDLHPVVVFSGLIIFDLLFGIVGMMIAVPIIAAIKIYLKYKYSADLVDDIDIEEMENNVNINLKKDDKKLSVEKESKKNINNKKEK